MSRLMQLPLLETHTVPGWPEVYDPSVSHILVLTVGLPVVLSAVITLFVMGPVWFQRSKQAGSTIEPA